MRIRSDRNIGINWDPNAQEVEVYFKNNEEEFPYSEVIEYLKKKDFKPDEIDNLLEPFVNEVNTVLLFKYIKEQQEDNGYK